MFCSFVYFFVIFYCYFSQLGPGGLVHTQCKPCAHAILDVWSDGEKELESMKREANYTGSLGVSSEIGIEGGHGIYTLASVRNKDPELATFRGLQDPTKAAQFTQVLTFGQYCSKLKSGMLTAPNIGTEYAAEEYDGGTVSSSSIYFIEFAQRVHVVVVLFCSVYIFFILFCLLLVCCLLFGRVC